MRVLDVPRKKAPVEVDVTDRLRAAIMNGDFLPNQRLIETELAEVFDVGRANIRTALAILEQERLVIREPNRGARVRLVSDAEAIEIAEARSALEALVARQAAERATVADCHRLEKKLAEMQALFDAEDFAGFSGLCSNLHAEIRKIARNATVTRLLEGLRLQVVRQQYRLILIPGRPIQSLMEHRAIALAILAKSPDEAERAMKAHLMSVVEVLKKSITNLKQLNANI